MATTAQRLAEYEELYKQAQGYDPNKFQNDFEKEYNEAVNYNKDLIEQQSSALGELQTVAPTLREKYMNTLISDPTAQMALIAQARQAPITQWSTASNLLNARGQRYQDILGKALGAYQTSANQANTAAENAWRLYQDALQQDQFNAQLRASRSSGGGGGGGINLASLLEDKNGNGIPDIYEQGGGTGQTKTAQQQVIDAINRIKALRSSSNIESKMPVYYNEIYNQAKALGLNLNKEALWQWLGNKSKTPQTLNLFM